MMRFYRVTDGERAYDMFLLVNQSVADKRHFPTAYERAMGKARKNSPDEWNRDDVLTILRERGWDVISVDYRTIREPLS